MDVQKIYFDMDSVLADFERGVRELCGMTPPSQNGVKNAKADDEMWDRIRMVDHFYDRLEMMPGSEALFHALYEEYGDECEILTGIPKEKRHIKDAGEDKTRWVHRLLRKDIKVNIVYREDKKNYCTGPACILIDDMEKNIQEWTEFGGTGILFKDAGDARKQLEILGIL